MPVDPMDPFELEGKNLRRVIPQVRRNIDRQRKRMIAHVVTFIIWLLIGVLGWQSPGFWRGLSIVFFILLPFSIIGFFADRHLKRWHESRLAECQRRLDDDRRGTGI